MDTIVTDDNRSRRIPPRAADFLQGETPHARGERKRRRVLTWIYQWGFSTAPLITRVSGALAADFARRLEQAGLLTATRTEAGGVLKNTPRFYYTLTELGQQEAERHAETLLRYPEIDSYRVNQSTLRHHLLAQQATFNALHANTITGYRTERMDHATGDQAGVKYPDVTWILPNGESVGVEIELSGKWDRKLDEFVLGIVRALLPPKGQSSGARFHRFAIVTDSAAIQRRYQEALQPGAQVHRWEKNSRQHWEITKTFEVPAGILNQVEFLLL